MYDAQGTSYMSKQDADYTSHVMHDAWHMKHDALVYNA